MKKLFLLLTGSFFFFACKKDKTSKTIAIHTDSFIFGRSGGLCLSCSYYFKIENGNLYKDSILTTSGRIYQTVPLSAAKYSQAVTLMNSFPTYLLQHPNTDYGCSGCADQRVFYLEIKDGGNVTRWNIDDVPSVQPVQIQSYLQQLDSIIQDIYP